MDTNTINEQIYTTVRSRREAGNPGRLEKAAALKKSYIY
jgi:hypothetical protein